MRQCEVDMLKRIKTLDKQLDLFEENLERPNCYERCCHYLFKESDFENIKQQPTACNGKFHTGYSESFEAYDCEEKPDFIGRQIAFLVSDVNAYGVHLN